MPPINDNFVNAISIGGHTGSRGLDTNVGATSEVGEPPNNGVTVWYKWTATSDDFAAFSTRHTDSIGDPNFRTVLQVFTGSSVSALTEVSYITRDSANFTISNYQLGSYVAFEPSNGTTYYIRVDGVAGATGNFPLNWFEYHQLMVGGFCNSCQLFPGEICISTVQGADLTSGPLLLSFGSSIPAGTYYVRYCQGYFSYNTSLTDQWTVSTWIDNQGPSTPYDAWDQFQVVWGEQGVTNTLRLSNVATLTVPSHGLTDGQQIIVYDISSDSSYDTTAIAVGAPVIYQRVTITVIDANNISYINPGPDLGSSATRGFIKCALGPFNPPPQTATDIWGYDTPESAQFNWQCTLWAQNDGRGGLLPIVVNFTTDVSMMFTDAPYTDNANGSNPVFGLFHW